jgi:acetyl-CoA carboxylase beta subunit
VTKHSTIFQRKKNPAEHDVRVKVVVVSEGTTNVKTLTNVKTMTNDAKCSKIIFKIELFKNVKRVDKCKSSHIDKLSANDKKHI